MELRNSLACQWICGMAGVFGVDTLWPDMHTMPIFTFFGLWTWAVHVNTLFRNSSAFHIHKTWACISCSRSKRLVNIPVHVMCVTLVWKYLTSNDVHFLMLQLSLFLSCGVLKQMYFQYAYAFGHPEYIAKVKSLFKQASYSGRLIWIPDILLTSQGISIIDRDSANVVRLPDPL